MTMRTVASRRIVLGAMLGSVLLLTSCMRAERFKAATPKTKLDAKLEEVVLHEVSWREPHATSDVPIVFVPDSSPEWPSLEKYWNDAPKPETRLIPFGLPPMQTLAVFAATERHLSIKIKVPRGLPDPTPHLPPTNLPTLARWQLGRKLFFEIMLSAGADKKSCAHCHDPTSGFTDRGRDTHGPERNTLSLINVVYNRRQFWDGRVEFLEETIVRSIDDERTLDKNESRKMALERHIWGGAVRAVAKREGYHEDFKRAFGVKAPTQDTIARALATYMRTILSGDSIYDRADDVRKAKKSPALTVEHFREAFKEKDSATRVSDPEITDVKPADLPERVFQGYEIFKKNCVQCHHGPLFTDQDYHNTGYAKDTDREVGNESGRVAVVPIGTKELRLFGAYRTPSLRNLTRTEPYYHASPEVNPNYMQLLKVVEFYDVGVFYTPYLADALKVDGEPRKLGLSPDERKSLVLFLRSLDGTQVDRKMLTLAE